MHCLFIDIASHDGFIALLSEEGVVGSIEINTRIRDHELIPLVEDMINKAGWNYKDLTNIACVIGPGGFTSLRVAVSFANTLMDQLGIDGAGVHLSDLYLERSKGQKVERSDVVWLHATKRDSIFVKGSEWTEPTMVKLEDFKEKVPQGSKWMGELLDEQIEYLSSKDLIKAELKSIEEVLPELILKQKFESKPLEPWYGRNG
ncbi:MAG: tRNA (adenosine(37)-N6)-threonylcarbamoyltransferase complex dimerization subunit type 1 TsaB [Kiritimatiellales bacterium]|nr:tRNA (adenosine(37)-N6)-threonylcarbamoyltransferase complex dimerization subunit type 1 TsaB [Kiritimatiellales bacterium]